MIKASDFKQLAYLAARDRAQAYRAEIGCESLSSTLHATLLAQACATDAIALEILTLSLDSPPPQKTPETPS